MINLLLAFVVLQSPLQHVSRGNVTVYYRSNISDSVSKDYLSTVEQMYRDDTAKFEIRGESELKIRLCHDAYEFSSLTGADPIFSPLWKDGILYVVSTGNLTDINYLSVLDAGVIRSLLDPLRQNGAPWWLINSAAVYESGEYKDCTSPPIENVDYFSDLDEKIQGASTPTELADLCFYLGTTGKFFDLKFGVGSLVRLVRAFQHEVSFDEAVKKVFHTDYEELESEWRDFLVKEAAAK